MKQWCQHQIKTKDDDENSFTCLAHYAERRIMECPYTSPANRKKDKYPCVDYHEVNADGEKRKEE